MAQYRLGNEFEPVAMHICVKEKNEVVREIFLFATFLPDLLKTTPGWDIIIR